MKPRGLERKLLRGVLAIFLIPTAVVEVVLVVLYRRGVFGDPLTLLLVVLVGLAAMMVYLGWVTLAIGRSLVRTVETLRHGTELMATVHPDYRIDVSTADELEALAGDINRLADHLRDARLGLEARVRETTRQLEGDQQKLAAILEGLAEGVVVTALDGRITLANRVAQGLLCHGVAPLGRSLFDFMDRACIDPLLDRLRSGASSAERISLAPSSGPPLGVAVTSFLDPDRRPSGFILALGALGDPAQGPEEDRRGPEAGTRFIGAGLTSGVAALTSGPERPELYDFSFLDEMERHVAAVARERLLDQLSFVVLDTETTGLRPEAGDRIVSLAGVSVRAGAVRRHDSFDALVRPERPIPPASTRFHGITDAMVAKAPPIGIVLPAFLRFAQGAVLVGHEVSFDLAFLSRDMTRLGLGPLMSDHPVLDTGLLSRLIHGPEAEHTLEAVAGRLGVTVIGRHSALGDALTTAEVLVRLLELLRKRGLVTLGQALDAVKRSRPRH